MKSALVRPCFAMLSRKDVDGAGTVIQSGDATTSTVCQADAGVLDLTCAAFAAQLPRDLDKLGYAGRSDGMSLAEQTSGRIDGNAPADRRGAGFQQLNAFAARAEPERFVVEQFGDRERVMHLRDVDFVRAEPRFLVDLRRSPGSNLRQGHVTKSGEEFAGVELCRHDPHRAAAVSIDVVLRRD